MMRHSCRTAGALLLLASAQSVWAFPPYFPPPGHPGGPAGLRYAFYPAAPGPGYPQRVYLRLPPPYAWGRMPRSHGKQPRHTTPSSVPVSPAVSENGSDKLRSSPVEPDTAQGETDDKRAFLGRLLPLVERENRRILTLREQLIRTIRLLERGEDPADKQVRQLQDVASRYRIDGDPLKEPGARDELLARVDEIPATLALAQAANESAWGQSRFAREGNNLFGIWTYDESKGIVPRRRKAGQKHLVRRFTSEAESVRYYLLTLNSHPAYEKLRSIRTALRTDGEPLDGLALAEGLERYSAKGEEYVRRIQAMIRRLDLAGHDGVKRAPEA